mgnify:CR=1 FL=1
MRKSYKTLKDLPNWEPATSNDVLRFKGHFLKRALLAIALTSFVGVSLVFMSIVCVFCFFLLGLLIGFCLAVVVPLVSVLKGEFYVCSLELTRVSRIRHSKGRPSFHAWFALNGVSIEKAYSVSRKVNKAYCVGGAVKFWGIKTYKGFYFVVDEFSLSHIE